MSDLMFLLCRSDPDLRHRGTNASEAPSTNGNGTTPHTSRIIRKFEAVRETYTPFKSKVKIGKHFIENYRHHIFILVIFFGICVGLFSERFYCKYTLLFKYLFIVDFMNCLLCFSIYVAFICAAPNAHFSMFCL